jgi:hypothetical protein
MLPKLRRLPLLLGTLGGALAGYLLSNDKLRNELKRAKDPETAAKTLGKHLQKDGAKLAHEVKTFVESPEVQRNLHKAKKFAVSKIGQAQREVKQFVTKKRVGAKVRRGMNAVKRTMRRRKT